MAQTIVLDLDKIHESIPEMAKSLADYMYDAAVFCFHHHGYSSGRRCEVRNLEETFEITSLVWTRQITDRILRTFGDTSYAVEFAAEGIACLTIQALTPYTVFKRSQRNDGVDFWLTENFDQDSYTLQRAARMESKGITDAIYPSDIKTPLDAGYIQSRKSDDTGLPVFIIATEFSKPVIVMVQR